VLVGHFHDYARFIQALSEESKGEERLV